MTTRKKTSSSEKRKPEKSAKEIAYRLLTSRALCSFQLRSKLREREFPCKEIDTLITELTQLGYVDDDEWLRAYVKGKLRAKMGPGRIRQKLLQIGFQMESINETLEEICDDEGQLEALLRLLKTNYRSRDLSDYKERCKVMAALLRKGFGEGLIRRAIETVRESSNEST